ncbi:MAG: hypothetical protein EXR82_04785 [Gammaproteobacteria bacterium]|nr:hypothetical protein [Gammaproteobacteria bacterium]
MGRTDDRLVRPRKRRAASYRGALRTGRGRLRDARARPLGPVAAFRDARVVKRLPKTRSGKILRASIRRIADGQPANAPATIDDPAILNEIGAVLGR